jgi:hypothetical protein
MRLPLIGTIVLTLFIAETVHAQKYPVRLSSPDHVGQKNRISLMGSRSQESASSQNGRILKSVSTNMLVIFEGREEVLAVDTTGMAVRESFTVEKFTNLENGITTVLLKPGSVILTDGSREAPNQIVLKGGVMAESARAAFSLVMPPHRPGSGTDDDVYGTKEPKGVGDRWTINKAAAVADLKDAMIIPIERMTGVSSIVSKGNFGGDECLDLLTEVAADGVALKNGPAGFLPDQGTMEMTVRACVPINPAATSRKEGVVINAQYRLKGMPGTPAESIMLETSLKQRVELTALPITP